MANHPSEASEFWDRLYASHGRDEPGPVNRHLIGEVQHLTPGRALDLGCGQGADVIWLAQRGWTVVGVDISAAALDRARAHIARLGLTQRIALEQHDLATSFPNGMFDLVSAQFLHNPLAAPAEREIVLSRAAKAVVSGGHLLVVSHHSVPAWHPGMPPGLTDRPLNLTVPTPEDNVAALHLDDGAWDTVRAEIVAIELTGPDGRTGIREDHLLHFRRR